MAKERARDASPEVKVKKRSSDDKVKKSKSKKDKKEKREKKEKNVKKIKEIVEEELEEAVEENAAEDSPPGSPATMVQVKDREVPATTQPAEEFISFESDSEAGDKKKKKKAAKEAKLKDKKSKKEKKEKQSKPLFIIDVGPSRKTATAVKPEPGSKTADDDAGSDSSSDSDSDSDADSEAAEAKIKAEVKAIPGLTREERRRQMLVTRQKLRIQKKLGVDPKSDVPDDRVEKELALWISKRDQVQVKVAQRRVERIRKKTAKRIRKLVERKEKKKATQAKVQARADKRKAKAASE